ncbi:binding--dependent transport system inner membrane component family protein [Anoxybacillus sp. B7M1]|jgi:peptide/nickel transport system permease protein|uniref:ABC transporter permease n=1 Tax=Anoxybacteroides rupiense TaxID=311460 RepID=A0ABD5IZ38_9BACL|nr:MULTISPECIES: nickel transporter permease [Anoxybacillus]ANB56758.1 binding--dependent transport system inner membrane component family protein [Anoxybacillus sp. B2M1]ANB64012.1 binding--dependent transport system inner membrane component family protein [Anoxybacillus sp. B7M1]KXG10964.1 Glutathione transport system permease protein GsiD [Anoxybacillus sp. P3H1B]MBB3907921.1 peptide/nickel transport system permease protein [Anoxybacillus rupiensis]MED5053113.1 ABC transporter permease [Ano
MAELARNQAPIPVKPDKEESVSLWKEGWRSFKKNKIALVGAAIVLFFILLAVFAPLLAPYEISEQNLSERLQAPSKEHLFGTDDFGRDILSRVIYGARISLWVGFFSVLGSVVVGSLLGIVAGYYGKWIDAIISRIFDIMLAFPSILLAIGIVAVLGPSLQNALIAIAVINIPNFGRLIRSRVLSIKQEEYIVAARAIGMSDARILFHHILPNSMAPIIVQGTLAIATAIIEAAALGFLGLGAQPPNPEWGTMLASSKDFLTQAPWTMVFPGLAIMLTVLGFNLMGDGLRDALDPRMKS